MILQMQFIYNLMKYWVAIAANGGNCFEIYCRTMGAWVSVYEELLASRDSHLYKHP